MDAGLKLHEAPEGRPLQDRLIDCNGPLTPVRVIVLEPVEPRLTVIPPEFERKKSKPAVAEVTVLLITVVRPVDMVLVGLVVVLVKV